jgi:hypothetical protein
MRSISAKVRMAPPAKLMLPLAGKDKSRAQPWCGRAHQAGVSQGPAPPMPAAPAGVRRASGVTRLRTGAWRRTAPEG